MAALSVRFRRDLRGQVVAVGTAGAPERFGRYEYRADGSLARQRLDNATLPRAFSRDSLRRTSTIDDPAFSVTLGYRAGGRDSGPYGDGSVTSVATGWKAQAFARDAPGAVRRAYG